MATINYADKFSPVVDEKFAQAAFTSRAFGANYDWDGVKTINVYSVSTSPLIDYLMTGTQRYGVPEELDNAVQTMVLSQDKAFTFSVDKRVTLDTVGAQEIGTALAREIREVVIPTVDKYRISVLVAGAGKTETMATTSTNAYSEFLKGTAYMAEKSVPSVGGVAFVNPTYYNMIRLDPSFIMPSDMGQSTRFTGVVGEIDGIPVVRIPSTYFPTNVDFMITHPIAAVSPIKIYEYKIHEVYPGISGKVAEGRFYYDAFVLNNKKDAIYVHKVA